MEEILFGWIFFGAHTSQTVSKHVWVCRCSEFELEKSGKNILRTQCNTTKAKPHNSNRKAKEEQNNYQMWIQKIQEQTNIEPDKLNTKGRHNSSKL